MKYIKDTREVKKTTALKEAAQKTNRKYVFTYYTMPHLQPSDLTICYNNEDGTAYAGGYIIESVLLGRELAYDYNEVAKRVTRERSAISCVTLRCPLVFYVYRD